MAVWEHWPWTSSPEHEEPDAALKTPSDEADLIACAAAGDEEAFAALFRLHEAQVFRFAFRLVRDREDAHEIVQDVFLSAWQGLPNFRRDARFGTWLHTITYRRALRTIEMREVHGTTFDRLTEEDLTEGKGIFGAQRAAQAEEHWQAVIDEQIEHLPPRYREVIALRHLQDLSYEEIAQELTLPISSVKTHLFRARQMLRERLQALDLASIQQGIRDRLPHLDLPRMPHVDLPHVEMPHVEMPHVEMPNMGLQEGLQGAAQAVRDRFAQMAASASNLGDILRGHLRTTTNALPKPEPDPEGSPST